MKRIEVDSREPIEIARLVMSYARKAGVTAIRRRVDFDFDYKLVTKNVQVLIERKQFKDFYNTSVNEKRRKALYRKLVTAMNSGYDVYLVVTGTQRELLDCSEYERKLNVVFGSIASVAKLGVPVVVLNECGWLTFARLLVRFLAQL